MFSQYFSGSVAFGSSVPMPTMAMSEGLALIARVRRASICDCSSDIAPSVTPRCRSSSAMTSSRIVATWPIMYMPSLCWSSTDTVTIWPEASRFRPFEATRMRPMFMSSRRSRSSSAEAPSRSSCLRASRNSWKNGVFTQRVEWPGPVSKLTVLSQDSAALRKPSTTAPESTISFVNR